VLLPLLAALLVATPAPKPLATYCSPSGDVCFGAFKRSGVVRLQITTAARYFPRYTLCVTPPAGPRRCGSFPILRGAAGSGYGTVRLSTFGATGAGTYRAQWRIGSGPLGPTLRVRV
jgi:hypothetical protein